MAQVGGPKRLKIDFGSQKWTQEDDFGAQEADLGGSGLPQAVGKPPGCGEKVGGNLPPTHTMESLL